MTTRTAAPPRAALAESPVRRGPPASWVSAFPPATPRRACSHANTTAASLQALCTGTQILLGCATTGSPTLLVAAAGPSATVFGGGSASGVTWYASTTQAWGFAPAGAAVALAPCDTAGGA